MPAILRVVKSEAIHSPADNGTVVQVTAEIIDGENTPSQKVISYPVDTTAEAIKEDLKKHLDLYNQEKVQSAEQAQMDEIAKVAEQTTKELENYELSA